MCARRVLAFLVAAVASAGVGAMVLDATKISTGGLYVSGISAPVALRTATAVGKLAGKWPLTIGSIILQGVISDIAGNNVQWLPGGSAGNFPVPEGWTSSNGAPATVPSSVGYKVGGTTWYPDPQAACRGYYPSPPNILTYACTTNGGVSYSCGSAPGCPSGSMAAVMKSTTCPSGYQNVSGTCNKNEGATYGYAKWPADGLSTMVNGGTWSGGGASGTWKDHVREPDADKVSPPTGTYTREGVDEYNNPTKETVQPKTDGGVDYKRWTQGEDSVGAPVTVTHNVTTNNAGAVTNNTYQYFANQTISTVTATGGTPTAAQPVDLQLPTDYSRESTLGEAKDALVTIKDKISEEPGAFPSLGEAPSFGESLDAFWQSVSTAGIGGALSGITANTTAGECPTASFEALGSSFTFDLHCQVFPSIAEVLSVVMLCVWAWVGIGILFSA
jgi:hypothetical protein